MTINIDLLINKLYKILWIVFSPFSSGTPTFVITHGMHYTMIKNILPYLPSYRIYPMTRWVEEYLKKNNIKTSKLFFPRFIIETNFYTVSSDKKGLSAPFKACLEIKRLKKIQLYHGVVDKNYTFSEYNKEYDLLLVPGRYALSRLRKIGIPEKKIKIVGYPKFDTYYGNNNRFKPALKKKVIVYAPTWGTISSLPYMLNELILLNQKYKLIVKPHYLTDWYYDEFFTSKKIEVFRDDDITKLFNIADLLISDSSSAMFEFLITGKPVIVLDTRVWLSSKEKYVNSRNGPEIMFRDIFYRVKDLKRLEEVINRLTDKKIKRDPNSIQIVNLLFEPTFPSGKRAADEILKFIKKNTK